MTQALVKDLHPGDLLLMRFDWIESLPLTHPWRIACTGIALGERLALGENPVYVHVGIVASVGATIGAIEELADGADRTQEPLDSRWDCCRTEWRDPSHPQSLIDYCSARIGTPYDYPGILFLGLERILGAPNIRHEVNAYVCSTLIASGLYSLGYRPWDLDPQEVAPSDFPGRGMKVFIKAGALTD